MLDIFIALVFVTLVASPVIVAAIPLRRNDEKVERHTKEIELRAPSASAGR